MNSKNTRIWLVVAAALFALIYFFQRQLHPPVVAPAGILPELRPAAVTSIQVIPSDAPRVRADHTNDSWSLTEPMLYPAQPSAIEALLGALQKLSPAISISSAQLRERPDANAEYGFEPAQTTLVIEAGQDRWQLKVGNKTAPGDQVYLQVVGKAGAFVVDAGWLKLIPRTANDWRDTAVASFAAGSPDWIVFTNNPKGVTIELHRDATNHLWRMTRPLPARADGNRITEALENLQAARVAQFITDDPKADLNPFGLEPANIDLWLGAGANALTGLHVGKSLTNDAAQVYLRREGWNAIVATAQDRLAYWYGSVNSFRDPYLLELTAPVAEIEVSGPDHFILQRREANDWGVVGEKFPVDADSVQAFIKLIAGMRVAEFVKDVVTTNDLPAYGLGTPERQITVRSAAGDTNSVIAQLRFGTAQGSEVFVRRADEDFVYAVTTNDFNRLPDAAWEFRARRIWDFSENEVAKITINQAGKTRQMLRNGPNKWSLAPGSQGIINDAAIEETIHRLGELTALAWFGRNLTKPEGYGFKPENPTLTIELKNGVKNTVDFGSVLPQYQTALAAVTLDGERWTFVFPPVLYQFVATYLTIPAGVP